MKYLSNFWRTFEILLINCKINHILTWPARCFITDVTTAGKEASFTTTYTKLYVSVVTLSFQDNLELLQKLKLGFKRTINWNKYQSKVTVQEQNWYLDFLIDVSFQGVNRNFVLWFENNGGRITCSNSKNKRTIMLWSIDETRNLFDQPVKDNLGTHDNIWKIQLVKGMIPQLVVY